jgi:hypothetical protein
VSISRIRVGNHIPELMRLDDAAFADRVEKLKQEPAPTNPQTVLVRRTIDSAVAQLETAPDRDALLDRLLEQAPISTAREALRRITDVLPPVHGRIMCHLLPNSGYRGSGNCFADDGLIIAAPCRGDATPWVRFVIAHEYSHTHRGFGAHHPETIRDHLVFEGLAMVLAETTVPKILAVRRGDLSKDAPPSLSVGEEGWGDEGTRLPRKNLRRTCADNGVVDGEGRAYAIRPYEICVDGKYEAGGS